MRIEAVRPLANRMTVKSEEACKRYSVPTWRYSAASITGSQHRAMISFGGTADSASSTARKACSGRVWDAPVCVKIPRIG